jgi:hypothetical protein
MAEAADSPRTGSTEITSAPRRGFVPPPPDAGEPYRPLSVAAVIGFGLAFLYSAYICFFAVFAYFGGDFLIFPLWTALLPVAIAVLCWVARRSIRHSEGTLSGERFASWGVGMTIVVGLCYWSYYAATSLALRQQAAAFVSNQYLPALIKGNLDEAFILTYKGDRPPLNTKLHNFIETYLDVPTNLKSLPPFTAYCQCEYVRIMQQNTDKVRATLVSTGTPTPERGGEMQVPLVYHIETPLETFELLVVSMVGSDRAKKKLWRIERDKTYVIPHTPVMRPELMNIFEKGDQYARKCVGAWIAKVAQSSDYESAYRDTLPPAQRTSLQAKIGNKPEAELKALAEKDPEVRAYFDGFKAFSDGSILKIDKKTFWAPSDAQGSDFIDRARKAFTPTSSTANWITLNNCLTNWKQEDGKLRLSYEVYLMLLPPYTGTGRLTVEADASELSSESPSQDAWRIVSLELLSCHPAPAKENDRRDNPL